MRSPSSLAGRLFHHAAQHPERAAVVSTRGVLSFAELAQHVEDRARRLTQSGTGGGSSVVGIRCDDEVEHLLLCLALAHAGLTSFTLPTHESAQAQAQLAQSAGAAFALERGGALVEVAAAKGADPLLQRTPGAKLLFSTSGTTGEPKLVVHSCAGLVSQAHRHVGGEERFACLASMEHNFAKRHRLYCVAQGGTNVFLERAPETLVEACRSLEVTTLHVSAFQAQELLGIPGIEALRGLRLKLGGSHVPAALRASLRSRVTGDLQFGYGTTETGAIGFTARDDADSGESVGPPLPGIEVRIGGAEPTPDARGELAIRCEGMFLGYLGAEELTRERLVDGWFQTGDVGFVDAQGRLSLAGRCDDMFVFNSMNIHPQDIEAQILEYPAVVDAVVLPQPSAVHGDVPVALVVARDAEAPDLRALKSFVRARTGLRCPKRFTLVDEIPRNAAGKILRAEARALLGAGQGR